MKLISRVIPIMSTPIFRISLMSVVLLQPILSKEHLKIEPFAFPRTYQVNEKAQATCFVTSTTQDINFEWLKNGDTITQSSNIRLKNSADFSVIIIDPVELKSAGNYTCKASFGRMAATHSSELHVESPPVWEDDNVRDIVVATGSNIIINCNVKGFPMPQITLKKISGNVFNPGQPKSSKSPENGTFSLPNVTSDDTGTYICEANNGVGTTVTKNISLVVQDKPTIQPFQFSKSVKNGMKASVICLVISSSKSVKFQWLKDGENVDQNMQIRIKEDSDFSAIIINPVNLNSSGNYTCIAKNDVGSNSYSAVLQVDASPSWIKEPQDIKVYMGETLKLECQAFGYPTPKIVWSKIYDKENSKSERLNFSSADKVKNASLVINNISIDDSGTYECDASNGVPPTIKKTVLVTVIGSPKIQPFQFAKNVKSGEKASVTCLVISSSQSLKFNWLKDGKDVHQNSQIRINEGTDISNIIVDFVNFNSTGNYTCIARNDVGMDSYSAFLQVEASPSWLKEPQDMTVNIGKSLILHCEATGYPAPVVAWTKINGIAKNEKIQNESVKNTSLIINSATINNSGSYECEANNGVSPSIKKNIFITVIGKPKIQPFSFKSGIRIGDKTTTLCSAETRSTLTYSWERNGVKLVENDNIRFKTDDELSLLIIDPVQSYSSGNYTCTARNEAGADSYTAALEVEAPPVWKIEPMNVTVLLGSKYTILCAANGIPKVQITWRKLGGNEENVENSKIISNSERLEFNGVNSTDSGFYQCEANNGIRPDLKKTIFVKVHGSPKIQPISFPSNIASGKSARFICSAIEGEKPLQFQWKYHNENDMEKFSNVVINNYDEYSLLVVNPIAKENRGNYTCIVKNSVGEDSFSVALNVQEPTTWLKEPVDVVALLGTAVTVPCQAKGYPLPKIKWQKIESSLQAISSKIDENIIDNGSLVINSVQTSHAGSYECEASNGIGSDLKKSISIIVRVPARFEEKFDVVKSKKGDSARMKCEGQGDQPLSITWLREQTVISKNDDNRYEIFETMEPKGVVSELIIRTTDREDGALYSCLAENEYGHDERKIRLLVMEVPAPPTDAKIREIWSRSASVSWAPPYSGNSPITQYIVQYWRDVDGASHRMHVHLAPSSQISALLSDLLPDAAYVLKIVAENSVCRDGASSHRLHELSAPSSQVSALLSDLLPGSGYVLKIVAENSVGRGEPSDAISFRTGEEEPSAPPTDINADPRGSSTIRVSWKPPPKDSWNGELKGYYVGYKTRDSSHPYSYKTTDYVPDDSQQEFFLSNLLKASDYSIAVKAFNSAGSGPPSHEMYVRTLDGDLPPAPALYVLATSSSSVTLTWNTRKIDNILSGYTVHFREEQGQWQEVAVIAPEDNTYTLGNLLPSRLYQIYVTATNKYGKGDPSEIVAIKTDDRDGLMLSVSNFGGAGSPVDMAVLIPVTASLLTICVVLIVACVCVRKIRSRHNLERALAAEKHLAMVGTLQRYVDIDKTRSLLDPNNAGLFPAPYETIPMSEEHQNAQAKALVQEVQACLPKDGTQTLYNKPMTLTRKDENIYDMPQ